MENILFGAFPPLAALVDVYNLLANLHDRIHVVRIDDRGDVVLLGDFVYEVVDHHRSPGIEARVGFVAKEVFGVEHDGAGDGHALGHAAREFGRVEPVGIGEPHALQTEVHALALLRGALVREQVERQAHVLLHGRGVQQRPALKDHADVLADRLPLAEAERREIRTVVPHAARIDLVQSHEALEQHGLARTAPADDEVRLARLELDRNVVEHDPAVERLDDVFRAYHINRICVRIRLKIMMTIEQATTARVEARPTSSELPLA